MTSEIINHEGKNYFEEVCHLKLFLGIYWVTTQSGCVVSRGGGTGMGDEENSSYFKVPWTLGNVCCFLRMREEANQREG